MTLVKICGLSTQDTVISAVEAGADFIGFVFYPPSPRAITPEIAAALSAHIPKHVQRVGLFVDPSDADIENVLKHAPLDMVQVHGSESPMRLKEIKDKFGLPLIKAIQVGSRSDIEDIGQYTLYADWMLFDAKPENASLPGGTGQIFDWSILNELAIQTPWMLSGGLNSENVAQALAILNPKAIDVSSGVEREKGVKDIEKIKAFINIVK
ncbi:MAG: phosphoribosylanthranilate isomerase [Alphaproteobacteria bacterium]|nr:phosphoribosylanthranilate isomerase [Alphaproteobacteria bacterium]